jgi:hypothetical protein
MALCGSHRVDRAFDCGPPSRTYEPGYPAH